MDQLDLTILKTIQRQFPLHPRPYEVLAKGLGVGEEEVFRRVRALRSRRIIRRVGPLFDSRKLGFRGHLVAVRADAGAVERVAALLDRRHEVTHNYLRDGRFNVWFTVMLPADAGLEAVLSEVRACPGVAEVRSLPSRKMFKLDTSFVLADPSDG